MLEYQSKEDLDRALKDATQAVNFFPQNEAYRLILITCQIRLQRLTDANAQLKIVLGMNPRNERALYHEAFVSRLDGKHKESIQSLTKIIAMREQKHRMRRSKNSASMTEQVEKQKRTSLDSLGSLSSSSIGVTAESSSGGKEKSENQQKSEESVLDQEESLLTSIDAPSDITLCRIFEMRGSTYFMRNRTNTPQTPNALYCTVPIRQMCSEFATFI